MKFVDFLRVLCRVMVDNGGSVTVTVLGFSFLWGKWGSGSEDEVVAW
jgi:hypothetical protein